MNKFIKIYNLSKDSVSTGKILSVSDPRSGLRLKFSNQTFENFSTRYTLIYIYSINVYKLLIFKKNNLATAQI